MRWRERETKEEREQRLIKEKVSRKKFRSEYYREFSSVHCEWLRELTKAYKDRGQFNLTPLILSSYYNTYEDKQIALLVSGLLLSENRVMEQVLSMRKLLGNNPYNDLYKNRRFVQLSNGRNQAKNIAFWGSTAYWKISLLLDILWNLEHSSEKTLYEHFMANIQEKMYTPYHALLSLFEELSINNPEYRINLTLLGFCGQDGIGERLWDIKGIESRLSCPVWKDLRTFLNTWMPKWRNDFTINEMSMLFGFEQETDLYYCVLAYQELAKYRRDEISKYVLTYGRLYKKAEVGAVASKKLKQVMPQIKFEKDNT